MKETLENKILYEISVERYYKDNIAHLDAKYKQGFVGSREHNKFAVCPLHNDHDPSLGLMKDRQHKGVLLYHCFGCGAAGDVIKLHRRIKYLFGGKSLNNLEAMQDLAEMYGIEYGEEDLKGENGEDVLLNKHVAVERCMSLYTMRNFQQDLQRVRMSSADRETKIIKISRAIQDYINVE